MKHNVDKDILLIKQRLDGEYAGFAVEILEDFNLSHEIAGGILITIADVLSNCIPEQHQNKFEEDLVEFFTKNYKKRFNSKEIEYVSDDE